MHHHLTVCSYGKSLLKSFSRGFSKTIIKTQSSGSKTDFGFQTVDAVHKQEMVKEVFSKVAEKYDIMNDLMSAGIHRLWKDEFVSMMGIGTAAKCQKTKVPRILDVAGGTGDIAFRVVQSLYDSFGDDILKSSIIDDSLTNDDHKFKLNQQVIVCDINPSMLAVGQQRAQTILKDRSVSVGFVEGNAELLPFADNTFDIYSIAFGLRNVTNKEVSLIYNEVSLFKI